MRHLIHEMYKNLFVRSVSRSFICFADISSFCQETVYSYIAIQFDISSFV